MRILVTGAYGLIGGYIVAGLRSAGHEVVGCGRQTARARRRFPGVAWIESDFNRDVTPEAWTPRLADVDAVVNCAGVLQESRRQSIDAVHRAAPVALFDACLAAGVRRVVQVSALGAEPAAGTAYAASKHSADIHLAGLDVDWVVLKPSLVYAQGAYGGTALFRGLAGFPFAVPLPGDGGQMFQPVHMADLVRAVCRLVEPDAPARLALDVVGPEAMPLRDILVALGGWLGIAGRRTLAVPMPLVRLATRCADAIGYLTGRG